MKASQGWQLQHDGKALAGPVPSPRESSTTRDTASPSEWREGDTYKFAVYSATSPSAVTFVGPCREQEGHPPSRGGGCSNPKEGDAAAEN